ncbi:MAG TPA: hypothetical protein VMW16_03065 [Sedimentisphaerales bacterium]|nr:hypothetical protein [Sedimentisphaerales bacterium]
MSAENPTAAELLTAVNAAILDLVTGNVKSISINDRSFTYQNLNELRDMRKQLQMEVREPSSTIRLGDVS